MKLRVTASDIAHGRVLVKRITEPGGLEAFLDWQGEHFGASRDVALTTFGKCAKSGDIARAERLFNAMATPHLVSEWNNLMQIPLAIARLAFAALVLLAIVGGASYALRGCL